MFAMSDLEMYLLPFLGMALMVLAGTPWAWMALVAPKRRDGKASGRQWMQFGLKELLLWVMQVAAIASWLLSWEGPFFTKRSVLSDKAAALTLLMCAVYVVLFVNWIRQMNRKARAMSQAKSAES